MVVWKFAIDIRDTSGNPDWWEVEMPQGAKVISAGSMGYNDFVWFWAIVNPDMPTEIRLFSVVGTGTPLPRQCTPETFVASTENRDGTVWHLFDIPRDRIASRST